MMRVVAPVLALVLIGLAACETTGNNVAGSADYDSLKRATEDCKTKGGTLVLKDQGDAQHIQDYVCKGT